MNEGEEAKDRAAEAERKADEAGVPVLVGRVRQLLDQTTNDDLAWSLGVTESIWRPDVERRGGREA